MNALRRVRVVVASLAWSLVSRWAARRRARVTPAMLQRHDFPQQTARFGLRFTELLRDRLRPGWLRLRTPDCDD